jgi:D-alanyl-D-alanine carboxypeptidase
MDRTLKVGEQWNAYDFLRFMMMTSSNTAAEAFGNQILPYSSFISLMNFKAQSLGLPTISVKNTSGLPIKQTVGNKVVETSSAYGSARDVAKLLAVTHEQYAGLIGYTSLYNYTFTSKLNGKVVSRPATSTNPLLASNPDVLGGKTGYTEASGGNLAVLVKTPQGKYVAIVVLGSTVDGRFIDVAALASSTKDFFTTK